MQRDQFLRSAILTCGSVIATGKIVSAQSTQEPKPLDVSLVRDFVIAGHGDFAKTKQMLADTPALLYATYDWKEGDFETALEGAGHVGNKEIANYLINLGARTNIFVLTMLGKTQMVKTFLDTFPQYLNARGPHGLTLLHHAQKGGDDSKELLDYLQSKGLKETKMKL